MPTKIRRDTSLPTRLYNKIDGFDVIYPGSYKYVVETVDGSTVSAVPRINPKVRLSDHSHALSILQGYHTWDAMPGISCPSTKKIRLDYHEAIYDLVSVDFAMTRSHFPQTGSATGLLFLFLGDGEINYTNEGEDTFTEEQDDPFPDLKHQYDWGLRTQFNAVSAQAAVVDLYDDANGSFYYPDSVGVILSATIEGSDSYTDPSTIDPGWTTYDDGTPQFPSISQQFSDVDPTAYSTSFSINPNATDVAYVADASCVESSSVVLFYHHAPYLDGDPPPTPVTFPTTTAPGDSQGSAGFESHDVDTVSTCYTSYSVPDTGFSDFVALDSTANADVNGSPPFSGAICVLNAFTPCT